MRRRLLLPALAAVAAALAGCASAPAQKTPLTVELYDLKARPPVPAPGPVLRSPPIFLPSSCCGGECSRG